MTGRGSFEVRVALVRFFGTVRTRLSAHLEVSPPRLYRAKQSTVHEYGRRFRHGFIWREEIQMLQIVFLSDGPS